MSEDKSNPKDQSIHKDQTPQTKIEKGQQINETRNYSESIGDLRNKAQGHYAKPVVNDSIIQKPNEDKGGSTVNTTQE